MTTWDYLIFGLYILAVLGVGFYHFRRNKSADDYYVGGRAMSASHVGLSVVATDVGGGFSIGLGGVGFVMGLSGSWLLFTGLLGAWVSAVLVIPKIKALDARHGMITYPDFLRHRYDEKVALLAAIISGVGYLAFTGGQVLAGAKLASTTLITQAPFGLSTLQFSLYVIAAITIVYTVVGGMKAVIYTDTLQWAILLIGLIVVTIPVTLHEIGGIDALRRSLPPEFFTLTNITPVQFINWMVTIVPIWLVGMTLYQRMYACQNEREAKKAWFIAGLMEYPVMAFTGVFLGMCARALYPEAEPEMGLPLLIRDVLPVGVTGIVIAAYFSAIMSTADSCLMASSGHLVNDVIHRHFWRQASQRTLVRLSQVATLVIGLLALVLASRFQSVLDAMLHAYAFMVSGLFVPTVGALFWKRSSSTGALGGMLAGGCLTLALLFGWIALPGGLADLGLDSSFYGIAFSALAFTCLSLLFPNRIVLAEGWAMAPEQAKGTPHGPD